MPSSLWGDSVLDFPGLPPTLRCAALSSSQWPHFCGPMALMGWISPGSTPAQETSSTSPPSSRCLEEGRGGRRVSASGPVKLALPRNLPGMSMRASALVITIVADGGSFLKGRSLWLSAHSTLPIAHLVRCLLPTVQSQTDAISPKQHAIMLCVLAQSEGPSIAS